MYIDSIKLRNFMSYKFADIKNLIPYGVIGVTGSPDSSRNSNGAGKTNLIYNSILFGLTGQSSLNLDSLINYNENEMETELLLKDNGSNNVIKISRKRNRLDNLKNSIQIIENNTKIDIRNAKFLQKYFSEKLNISHDIFNKYHVLSNFMRVNNAEKVQIIENLYNDINWQRYYILCLENIKLLENNKNNLAGKIEILENSKLTDILKKHVERIQSIEKTISDLNLKINALNDRKTNLEAYYTEYLKYKDDLETYNKQLQTLKSLTQMKYCPTCLNELDINKQTQIVNNKVIEIDNLQSKINSIKHFVDEYNGILKSLYDLNQEMLINRNMLASIEKEKCNMDTLVAEQNHELQKYKKEMEIVSKKLEYYVFIKDYIVKEGSLFRSNYIKEYLYLLSKLTNQYLSQLNWDLNCMFLLNENNEIETKFNIPVVYEQFSSGQKKLFDVCLTLSLFEIYKLLNKNVMNFIIFDEFVNYLDEKNEKNLLLVLELFAKTQQVQVFLISPRPLRHVVSQNLIVEYNKERGESIASVIT